MSDYPLATKETITMPLEVYENMQGCIHNSQVYLEEVIARKNERIAELVVERDNALHGHDVCDEWRSHWQSKYVELEAAQRWIPVSEPPKKGQLVVVYFLPVIRSRAYTSLKAVYVVEQWPVRFGSREASHWMPITPPQEAE